jgi:hypothetical protein
VVNVNVAGLGPSRAIIGTSPRTRRGLACCVGLDVLAIALQDVLADGQNGLA